jgi:tetratricopeptide (TPR) repeat protein
MRDQYLTWIDQVIADTLKGNVRSKEQLVQRLARVIEAGTGEVFEQCLMEQVNTIEAELAGVRDELKQAKISRKLRALKTVQDALGIWMKQNQAQNVCTGIVQRLREATVSDRLSVLVEALDPNQPNALNHKQIQQLAIALQDAAIADHGSPSSPTDGSVAVAFRQLAEGLTEGLKTMSGLESHLISWLYDGQRSIGFGATTTLGPWEFWSKQVHSPLPKALFTLQAHNQSAATLFQGNISLKDWVELWVVLRGIQSGLVTWFDQQPYSAQGGRNLAGVTFLVFATLWSELTYGFRQSAASEPQGFGQACFQMALQILRTFAQRDNFPLYGGVLASFSGEGIRDTIAYLDQPLKSVDNTQEKARILTVLGYSQRWVKNIEGAIALHQEALTLAREAGDQRCTIANFNHLSYIQVQQQNYRGAIAQAQQALILARQMGDRLGEAHALANLGYSEVMEVWQAEVRSSEALESPLEYLQRGLELATKFQDGQSQAMCALGLGIAYVAMMQPLPAQAKLESALVIAQTTGDRTVQALSHGYLGEALYQSNQVDNAGYHGSLGMYLLEQLQHPSWRQAATLLITLKNLRGIESWAQFFEPYRSKLMTQIGMDGVDYLPTLINKYQP